MCAQIAPGKLKPAPGFNAPDWAALAESWNRQVALEKRADADLTVSYGDSTISIGHDDFDHLDGVSPFETSYAFGWDNETPKRDVRVPAFKISKLVISNADYLAFYQKAGCPKELLPGSWYTTENGGVNVKVLVAPGHVSMDIAKHWPCLASGKQLQNYATSVGGRLPTEPELRRYIMDNSVDHTEANIGFKNWHPFPYVPLIDCSDL